MNELDRISKMIKFSIESDILESEENIEKLINSCVDDKVNKIKEELKKITLNSLMSEKWGDMLTNNK